MSRWNKTIQHKRTGGSDSLLTSGQRPFGCCHDERRVQKPPFPQNLELAALKYTGAGGKHAQTGALIEEHILETDTQLYLKCQTHWSIISQPYLEAFAISSSFPASIVSL
jgi:hypothetical protein